MAFLFFVACLLVGFGLGRVLGRRRAARRAGRDEKIDLLLLLSAPRVLTEEHLRTAACEAFGHEPNEVMVKRPGGTIRTDGYALVALPVSEPMMPDLQEAAKGIPELRMRIAFLEHRAYVVVTCVERPKEKSRDDAYASVGRLAAALVDDTTSLVYAPEAHKGLLMNETTLVGLRSGDPLAAMGTMTFDAIGLVSGEDPRMIAATAEARQRLPEFVAAVRSGLKGCLVKGPFTDGTHTEFMWIEAREVSDGAIQGILANEPFQVRGLRKGASVEVAFTELSDWCYPGETEIVGMFTERIVRGVIGA